MIYRWWSFTSPIFTLLRLRCSVTGLFQLWKLYIWWQKVIQDWKDSVMCSNHAIKIGPIFSMADKRGQTSFGRPKDVIFKMRWDDDSDGWRPPTWIAGFGDHPCGFHPRCGSLGRTCEGLGPEARPADQLGSAVVDDKPILFGHVMAFLGAWTWMCVIWSYLWI